MTHPLYRRTPSGSSAKGAADFLYSHERMAAIVPAVSRIVALRKDCSAILPAIFPHCDVLRYESDQLLLGAPNAALASRLRQQLPQLRDALLKRGWKVDTIRIKLRFPHAAESAAKSKQLALPSQALAAFAQLSRSLDSGRADAGLREAVARLVERHRQPPG